MKHGHRTLAVVALMLSAVALLACGSGRDRPPVRVGSQAIASSALAHWMSVMAPQHLVPEPPHYASCVNRQKALAPSTGSTQLEQQCRSQYESLRQEVLSLLISERWLTGEAAAEGMRVSGQEIARQLEQRRRSFASRAQFEESLQATDHTTSDLELELRAELAANKIRQRLIDREPKTTQSQIAAYYRQHIESYHLPEKRYFHIVENLASEALALKLSREFKRGTAQIADNSLSESIPRGGLGEGSVAEHRIIYKAIFAAKLRVLTRPVLINHFYFLVEVTRIVRARLQPLSEVQASIGKQLTTERRNRALDAFTASWRARWTARTDCQPGYVVERCRQYRGSNTPDEPLALN